MISRSVRLDRLDPRRRLLEGLGLIPPALRRHMVLVHDLVAAYLSFPVAVILRFGEPEFSHPGVASAHHVMPLLLALFLASSSYYRLHLGVWRFASVADLLTILKVASVSIAGFYLLLFLLQQLQGVPRSLPLIQWFVLVFLLGGGRFSYRLLRGDAALPLLAARGRRDEGVPVLLVGTGSGTSLFIKAARASGLYRVVGIVGTDQNSRGRLIHHVPVLGEVGDVEAVVARLDVTGHRPARLVVTDRLPAEVMEGLVARAGRMGAVLCRTPDPVEFKEPAAAGGRIALRPVAIADLLSRPQVVLNHDAIERFIAGRRVLVTGAGGSIGSELVRQIASRGPAELVLLDQGEFNLYSVDHEVGSRFPAVPRRALLADVRDRGRTMAVFAEHRPELVFHAAALKHVPMVELNPCEGVLTNAVGTRNVADACVAHGVGAMVLVSTDKAVNPTNVMGASKRLAEFYCQALDVAGRDDGRRGGRPAPRFMTVRFGNVLGSSGSVVPLFQRQLERGGPLTVTHPDIKRYFMTIPEAVSLILHASAHGMARDDERGEIKVLDMGEPVRVLDIARKMIRLAGQEPGTDIGIAITGLRPGEKLYEELFDDEETRRPSQVGGVFTALSRPIARGRLVRAFDAIEAAAASYDEAALRERIEALIPGYAEARAASDAPRAA